MSMKELWQLRLKVTVGYHSNSKWMENTRTPRRLSNIRQVGQCMVTAWQSSKGQYTRLHREYYTTYCMARLQCLGKRPRGHDRQQLAVLLTWAEWIRTYKREETLQLSREEWQQEAGKDGEGWTIATAVKEMVRRYLGREDRATAQKSIISKRRGKEDPSNAYKGLVV